MSTSHTCTTHTSVAVQEFHFILHTYATPTSTHTFPSLPHVHQSYTPSPFTHTSPSSHSSACPSHTRPSLDVPPHLPSYTRQPLVSTLPVPGSGQNWMEVAYGTQAGSVRVVVRHPENIGQAPQLFQSYNVHTCPILRVVLGEKHLISGSMRYYVMMMSLYVHWWAEFSASVTRQPTGARK